MLCKVSIIFYIEQIVHTSFCPKIRNSETMIWTHFVSATVFIAFVLLALTLQASDKFKISLILFMVTGHKYQP